MKRKIFVDGQEGTTGLQINGRLNARKDIMMLEIDPDKRKDINERRKFLNKADIAFLCLPDTAAREAVSFIDQDNKTTRIIDASTAHRTSPDWIYGLPELGSSYYEAIRSADRVSVPGCHATGFNLLLFPLASCGILPSDYPVSCHSVTGYSGGGKKMIAEYEGEMEFGKTPGMKSGKGLESPRLYALGLKHKHLPEMQKICGLDFPPLFSPIVGNFYQGMTVAVPINLRLLSVKMTAYDIHEHISEYYKNRSFIRVMPFGPQNYPDDGYINATACNGTNRAELFISGHDTQILLAARFDNLGKGASGAAVQNMNIMLGMDEKAGLE
ncbi:MAG: N-acetyl-gamma-glutamyl-phosphate reductase [Deltaproteobacteria bacterium]|nr:N-acetyl-gamma-glutamyl-phosphate reductase [Deltaproteobacteria bacterium]